jgi:hypothetical protein
VRWPWRQKAHIVIGVRRACLEIGGQRDVLARLWDSTAWLSVALGIAFIALGLLTAPWLLRRYAALARPLQGPPTGLYAGAAAQYRTSG